MSWVTTAELRENYISATQQQVTQEALEDFQALRMYRPGSVMMAMYGATTGRLGMIEVAATCNQACCVFEVSDRFHNRFLFYWLWHRRGDLIALSVGGGQPNLSQQDLREERVLCPPLDTQRGIARFLDEKTARINGLIKKKRALLDRLAEKRQALITRAVTKGLNPDAPMNPSGIDWSGDIPEHSQATVSARPDRGEHHQDRRGDRWASKGAGGMTTVAQKARAAYGDLPEGWTRRRLRFDVHLNPKKSSLDMESDVLVSFIPMDAVGEYGGLDLDDVRELEDVYDGYTYFADGDLCIAKITPCFENGKGALAEGLTNGVGFGTTELHVVRPGPNIDRRFLFYASIADDFRKLGESEMYGAGGQKRIDESFIKDWMAPLPPLDTQRRIARFLDEKMAWTDTTAKQILCSIEYLSEYRSALITAAVTGQLAELR